MVILESLAVIAGPAFLLSLVFNSSKSKLSVLLGRLLPWFAFFGSLLAALMHGLRFLYPAEALVSAGIGAEMLLGGMLLHDNISISLSVMVSFLGVIISRYAATSLRDEERLGYFMKWYSVSLGSVLCMLISGNLIMLMLSWMGTSFGLHKLLLFYPERPAAQVAAWKKFIISRIGDAALIMGGIVLYTMWGTLSLNGIFTGISESKSSMDGLTHTEWVSLNASAFLFVLGALIKSAQVPFHTWLPDTLETPSVVSAFMHAGIINAGGFLIIRMSPLIVESMGAMILLGLVGALTSIFAVVVMQTQTSIKKTLAFSTVGQMGFMMVQCGLGAFHLALLHILAHSIYKAHAFLSSGELRNHQHPADGDSRKLFPVNLLLASAVITALYLVFPSMFSGGVSVLLFILALGLTQLGLFNRSQKTNPYLGVLMTSSKLAAILTLYLVLHQTAKFMWLPDVETSSLAESPLWGVYLVLVAGVFTIGWGLNYFLDSKKYQPLFQKLYVHASHAFYFNTLMNRMMQRKRIQSLGGSFQEEGNASGLSLTEDEVDAVKGMIAPLWPLREFVAVNSYIGFRGNEFWDAASQNEMISGTKKTLDIEWYTSRLESEPTLMACLGNALEKLPESERLLLLEAGIGSAHSLWATAKKAGLPRHEFKGVKSLAAYLDQEKDGYWQRFIKEDISRKLAAYFDKVQSQWAYPFRGDGLYDAWRKSAVMDPNPELGGLHGFRALVKESPETAREAIFSGISRLGLQTASPQAVLFSELFQLKGWAGYLNYLEHENQLGKIELDSSVEDLMAIVLIYAVSLKHTHYDQFLFQNWEDSIDAASKAQATVPNLIERVLQETMEALQQEKLFTGLSTKVNLEPVQNEVSLQAAFCIDVRSELYRRNLESVSSRIETFGCAGFFGMPIGSKSEGAVDSRCPVLIAPVNSVEATTKPDIKQFVKLPDSFKNGLPGCFPYVETMGLPYLYQITNAAVCSSNHSHFEWSEDALDEVDHWPEDLAVNLAFGLLKQLALMDGFAQTVLLVGHGSATANNPHAAGLQCGACGGHSGELNVRIAARLMNKDSIRKALEDQHGITIPESTRFLAGLHNTTSEEVVLFPEADHRDEPNINLVQTWFDKASHLSRLERNPARMQNAFSERKTVLKWENRKKCYDWSEVQPEWGLAGNYAIVVGSRELTKDLNLNGRVFLHEYNQSQDLDGSLLETILTAPVEVASWINLQYYASVVDNDAYGSGNKLLHNISAGLGVLEGNGGDIRSGLALQSLKENGHWVHEPLRLNVVVQCHTGSIDSVLEKHEGIRQLAENKWIHLFAVNEFDGGIERFSAVGEWEPVVVNTTSLAELTA